MIFRNHSNMLICCSRNISDYYQCWKQLCCTIFLCKPWYIWLQADVICVSSLLTQGFCSLQVRGVCCYCANKRQRSSKTISWKNRPVSERRGHERHTSAIQSSHLLSCQRWAAPNGLDVVLSRLTEGFHSSDGRISMRPCSDLRVEATGAASDAPLI